MSKLFVYLSLPFLWLHFLVRFCGQNKGLYEQDQFFTRKHRYNPFSNTFLQFAYYIIWLPEYRSVFYKRVGIVGKLMSVYLPGQRSLYIRTKQIGGGICVSHGHSTEINAKRIGNNCHIFQNVTIGTNGSATGPTIGDNCFFGAGCVVIGNIFIGNNVSVGANAVVVKDIPDNCTVVCKGMAIVKKDGERVKIQL